MSALLTFARPLRGARSKPACICTMACMHPSPQRCQVVDNDFPDLSPVDLIVFVLQSIADAADTGPWLVGNELLGQCAEFLRRLTDTQKAMLSSVECPCVGQELLLRHALRVSGYRIHVVDDVVEAVGRSARRHARDPAR